MKKWLYAVVPIAVLLSLIVLRIGQKQSERAADAEQHSARSRSALVSVAPVAVKDLVRTLDATGSVEAPLNVKIAPKITGRVEYLQIHEGDRVRKRQVLVRIDPSEVEAEVRQQQAAVAEAQYRLAQAQLTQNSTTVGVYTQIRQQKAGVASALADYNQVKRNYEAQLAAASSSVSDAQGRVESANAQVANAQASINSAQANLDNARTKYNRIHGLYIQGFVAAQDVDDAKAALSVQESALEVTRGQYRSAIAQKDSASAQKHSAEQQARIVKTKGLADIEAARAKLEQAKASSDYALANKSQSSAYAQSIAALRASVDAARAGLHSAMARRADTVLISPLDGFVTGRYVDPGAVITAGQAALAVQFMHQVWVTIDVPEEDIPNLHLGQKAQVAFDAFQGKTFTGSIIQINPSADPQSRQFTVRVILDNKQNLFRPGMFAHVSIDVEHFPKAIVVPREAIQHNDRGDAVMVVTKDNKVERRPVKTGTSDTDVIAITEGVTPGEHVVVMSSFTLRDGQSVRVGGGKRGHKGRRH